MLCLPQVDVGGIDPGFLSTAWQVPHEAWGRVPDLSRFLGTRLHVIISQPGLVGLYRE